MTIEEIKKKYGDVNSDGYIRCMNCPIYRDRVMVNYCLKLDYQDGRDNCCLAIQKYLDDEEPTKTYEHDGCVDCKYEDIWVDMVDHPSHYNQGGMETIDEMELIFGVEAVMDFCLLNAWKYRARAAYKGKPEEDMEKANWYLNKYKELMEREYGKGK